MALKAVLTTLDELDEPIRALYSKGEDGRYYAVVEGVDDMPAVRGLKAKNAELLDEVKALKRTQEQYGGVTPEQVAELKKKAESSGTADIDAVRAEYEARIQQAAEKARAETDAARAEAEAEREAARRYFLDGETTRAITAARGVPELLSHIVTQAVRVERGEDGRFSLRVLGPDGQPRIKDSQGNPYSLDDLVAELRADPKYGRAFEPDGRTGSGATGGGRANGGTPNPFKAETRNLTEQSRLVRESPDQARRLAAEAGVSLAI